MKYRILSLALLSAASLVLVGCAAQPQNIDLQNDQGHAVMGLDYRDFNNAANQLVQSLLASGALKKDGGGRYVMTTAKIVNDTMQRIDTDQLMAKIEEGMMNSGQVVMTSAIGGKGATDKMVYQVRELRDNDEFKQNTIAKKGQLIAPELSISGKIIQRDIRYERSKTQVEYYFQLRVTHMTNGLRVWQKETIIGKRGSRRSVSW
ncbi:MAG: penicillin-binding protein activator LpoB [Lentisphaeria bacterium]|nr:penicillin-binding protein activator LpoB [Lentisphaeria bacterium]